jgi:F-type H+-transporting ATPase subunit delta
MKISSKQLAQTLYDMTEGKSKSEVEKAVRDFGLYLAKNRKLKFAEKISQQFAAIYNKKNGIMDAEVVTQQEINETLEKKIKHFLKEKYLAKEVVLKNIVDKDIKGGMILKVGDEVLDGSVRGKLNRLKNILV